MGEDITILMLEIETIPFKNKFSKCLGHISTIAVMGKVDTFNWLVLPIEVRFIGIGPDVGAQLRLDFQLLFLLHDLRSQQKLNILYVDGETVCFIRKK